MCAFGPFKDEVEIDFENERINKGLLLVSGDTGAGKTTIFDAICFALYGQASGESRGANGLKSDFAPDNVVPYVNLEFYYKNKYYEVKRTPEYYKPKSNGSGMVKKSQTAETEINGIKLTKITQVNNALAELIGLDYKQFRQVAMLSQGEFTKFLLADSKEKTTIFRKIFGTEFYDILQYALKDMMLSKKHELEKVNDKIDTEKKNLKDIIDIFGLNNDETIAALTEKIAEDEKTVNETKEARDKKEGEKTELFNEVDKIKKLNENILTYQEACQNLDALLKDNPNIEEEKKQYDYNIEVANPISKVFTALNIASKSLTEKKEQCVKHRECLEIKIKECEEKQEDFKKLEAYPAEAEKLANEINDLINTDKIYENYLSKSDELVQAKNKCKELSKEHKEQNDLYESMREKYYLSSSIELADTLVDGEPCPVCGSIHHPNKATPMDVEFNKEDMENCEKVVNGLDGKRKKIEAKIEAIENTIKEFELPEDLDVKEKKEKNLKILEEKKEEKEKLDVEFKELTDAKQDLDSAIKTLKGKIEMFEKDIGQLEENIKAHNIELEKLYNENDTDYDDYISKKLDGEELSKLKAKIDAFHENKTKFESIIEHLKEEVKGKEVVDVSEMEEQLKTVTEEYEKLDKAFLELSGTLKQLTTSAEHIVEYIESSKEIQSEFDVIKVLSDTANGSLTGKQKITFENYVQSYLMEKVLDEANKRFIKMTDSRYELKKKEIEIKKTGRSGLDFSIFDSYTGKERDVSSLSGGEKFKASLALALGLSDVISNNKGGIKIESLFIDEGFGSLDSESLNQALNILYDLSGNHKLIGVISHVSELKTRIDNKILVKKTNAGSDIEIETNV